MRQSAKKTVIVLLCVLAVLVVVCGILFQNMGYLVFNADSAAASTGLYINEVVSSNSRSLIVEELGSPDWIEIYNSSERSVNLSGYGLSDNIKEPHKWRFPAVSIPAGGHLVVYATKAEGQLCTGFGLSKAGESLYFSNANFELLDQLMIPELSADVSYARAEDGTYGYCVSPSPGEKNSAQIFANAEDILYSSDSALIISEVLPKNEVTLKDATGIGHPYVELHNASNSAVMLSDFYLSDDTNDTMKWRLPAETLPAGGYTLVFLSGGEAQASSGQLHATFKLSSSDDILCLSDTGGKILQSVSWALGLPEDVCVYEDKLYSAFPTPGEENTTDTFTVSEPSAMDSSDPVRVSEVLVDNRYSLTDADGDRNAWVELYNSSQDTVSLASYTLSDDASDPYKWHFPKDAQIQPGEYYVVFLSGKDKADESLHTSFRLSGTDGALVLGNLDGLRLDQVAIDPNISSNVSIGRGNDGEWGYFASPTPGTANTTNRYESLGMIALPNMHGVHISEVCGANAPKSGHPDWIELHNASNADINLSGWYITDDPDQPQRFEIPSLSVPAGGYAVINATTRTAKQEGVMAPFGISEAGETLILTDKSGNIADIFQTGALKAGVSSGRTAGDPRRVFFTSPTKGTANAAAVENGYVAAPVFSENTLYHKAPFKLELSCTTPGASLYYTTDGSKPSSASTPYTGPIEISNSTPVRAIALREGYLASDVSTNTYLFEEPHTLPVICINMDKSAFNEVSSVTDRFQKIERESTFAYYETNGKLGTGFPCGLRINGASTLLARQKSYSIFLRTGYGVSETSYPFFEDSDVDTFTSLVIRNSGQDRSKARLRDSFFNKVAKGLNVEYVETRPVVVYVNGQYWGIYDFNENQNEDYMAAHYGIDPDAVDVIRRNETPLEGTRTDMYRVRRYAREVNLADDAKFAEFSKWVDTEYFIDYLAMQSYFSNGDMFNQKYWRSQDYTVKWRPVYYDLDLALSSSNPTANVMPNYFKPEGVPSMDGSLTNMDLFCGLRKNQAWCDSFCERYVYLVFNAFDSERVIGILDEIEAELEPEMQRHIQRWDSPSSVSVWKSAVNSLRSCLAQRKDYALKYLKNQFGLSESQMQAYIQKATAEQTAEN